MEQFIQIKIENSEDFKNEIISGVVNEITNLGLLRQTPAKAEPKEMLTRIETAARLRISLVKLWDITKKGELTKYKKGGKVLYKNEDITEFINSNF
jgi:hypothetical protein